MRLSALFVCFAVGVLIFASCIAFVSGAEVFSKTSGRAPALRVNSGDDIGGPVKALSVVPREDDGPKLMRVFSGRKKIYADDQISSLRVRGDDGGGPMSFYSKKYLKYHAVGKVTLDDHTVGKKVLADHQVG